MFEFYEEAKTQIDQSIEYYNNRLPHSSVDMLTPNAAHYQQGDLKKHWKRYWKEKQEARGEVEEETEGVVISNQSQS